MKKQQTPSPMIELFSLTADKVVALANANSVLGERVSENGVTVIPVSKLSVGFAGGGADVEKGRNKRNAPAGTGAKVSLDPVSFLVIDGKDVRLLAVPGQEKPSKVMETVTAVAKQLTKRKGKNKK